MSQVAVRASVNDAGEAFLRDAVISIVIPKTDQKDLKSAEQVWNSFCNYSSYFTSLENGRKWFEGKHVEPIFFTIAEGHELGGKWFAQIIHYA